MIAQPRMKLLHKLKWIINFSKVSMLERVIIILRLIFLVSCPASWKWYQHFFPSQFARTFSCCRTNYSVGDSRYERFNTARLRFNRFICIRKEIQFQLPHSAELPFQLQSSLIHCLAVFPRSTYNCSFMSFSHGYWLLQDVRLGKQNYFGHSLGVICGRKQICHVNHVLLRKL